jgi:hypothetical protein
MCKLIKQQQREVFEDVTKLSWRSCELKSFYGHFKWLFPMKVNISYFHHFSFHIFVVAENVSYFYYFLKVETL